MGEVDPYGPPLLPDCLLLFKSAGVVLDLCLRRLVTGNGIIQEFRIGFNNLLIVFESGNQVIELFPDGFARRALPGGRQVVHLLLYGQELVVQAGVQGADGTGGCTDFPQ